MKAQIFEVKRFAVHDGDGIRTTVFFKGCPLRCVWCHNPEGLLPQTQIAYYAHKCQNCGTCAELCAANTLKSGAHVFDQTLCNGCGECARLCPAEAFTVYGREVTSDELLTTLLEDKPFYESSGGGITLSGGECLCQADFCAELLQKCKAEGLHTAVDTCGFVPRAALDKVMPYTDVFLYDLKAFDEDEHIRCTGVSNGQILENLRYLDAQGKKIEIRIPYVPHYNDDQMEKIGAFLKTLQNVVRVRVLAYHNYAGSKYAALGMPQALPATLPTDEEIERAKAFFE